jgi:hypothetical protein
MDSKHDGDDLFDRPDVENPDVGPFIAYFDAWLWLTNQIHQQKLLPIDEAGSRAEKTIRDICMNTPEKLTMWGFQKATDAALKRITREDWQGLSINPLAGQPEGDLKALGYRREYGAATKGEYGPVIWTGLCFDRKQFVAAFVPTPPADRRGMPPKANWPAIEEAFMREVAENGVPDEENVDGWQRLADVERWIAETLSRRRKNVTVSRSTLRRHAKAFLSRARKGS